MKSFKLILVVVLTSVLNLNYCFAQNSKAQNQSILNKGRIPTAMFMSDFHIGEIYGSVSRVLPNDSAERSDYIAAHVNGQTIYYHKDVARLVHSLNRTLGRNRKIQYLILVGDIFDMAIHNESDVWNLAHTFFNDVRFTKNKRTFISYFDKIIYIPGNHDHHVWKMLQEEYYIANHLKNHFSALPIPQQSIGLLNLENDKMMIQDSIIFHNHSKNFLSAVLSNDTKPVYVAYPNLYIEYNTPNNNTGAADGICVTHGHFFEPGWNKTTLNFDKHLPVMNDSVYFSELEKNNSPLTEFSDFEVAQMIDTVAQGMSDLQFDTVSPYKIIYTKLSALYPQLFPIKMEVTHKPKDFDIKTLMKYPNLVDPYLIHTQEQMSHLRDGNTTYSLKLNKLVYGHTHVPCFNVKYVKHIYTKAKTYIDLNLTLYNTGGWVNINSVSRPNPMFLYQDGSIKSVFKGNF